MSVSLLSQQKQALLQAEDEYADKNPEEMEMEEEEEEEQEGEVSPSFEKYRSERLTPRQLYFSVFTNTERELFAGRGGG